MSVQNPNLRSVSPSFFVWVLVSVFFVWASYGPVHGILNLAILKDLFLLKGLNNCPGSIKLRRMYHLILCELSRQISLSFGHQVFMHE